MALAAQGLHRHPARTAGRADVLGCVERLAVVQIDSVNVLSRAHYLPAYSRVGGYRRDWLDDAAVPGRRPVRIFEYWGHEASLLPVSVQPLLRWRMARADSDAWGGMRRIATERADLVATVRQAVADEGPVTAALLEERHGRSVPGGDHWGWRWSEVKQALEYLFWSGQVCSAGRGPGFARRYDLPERVLPPEVLATPTPAASDAVRALVELAARAHGVATEPDLRDYFRLPAAQSRTAVAELVEEGVLRRVDVEGWPAAYLHHQARVPRRVAARALLAPFDPLVWTRPRAQRLFGFAYRLEIYVPAGRRVHGYYVLPFLLGERLVARVDLKLDRGAGALLARASWAEPHAPAETGQELAGALVEMAAWLGADRVEVQPRGDVATEVARHLPW